MTTAYAITNHDMLLDEVQFGFNKTYTFKIKDMPHEEKPREKMMRYGAGALSVTELVAVLLSTGTKKEDVMNMAARIVKDYGERTLVNHTNPTKLAADMDIPLMKAFQIVACAELGRRFYAQREYGLATIRTAQDVFEYLHEMRSLSKEHVRGLYLNTHHQIIHDEVISIGTINSNLIHPREVFKPAIEYAAVAVILAHNHPSGIVTPSQADIDITNHLVKAGKMIGIPLVDHVVVTKDKFMSINVEY